VVFFASGLVLGMIYAIVAATLTLRYASSGILNFAFGAEAYFIARLYYFLNTQHGMPTALAAVLSIVVASALLGAVLHFALYSRLRLAQPSVKLTVTIGVSVALPALAAMLFGSPVILTAPGLASTSSTVRVFGAPVTYDQLVVLFAAVAIAVAGAIIMRFTSVGLVVRATVESPALASMAGVNPARVSLAVSVGTTVLAGLTGVLLSPIAGIGSSGTFAALLASSLGAVAAARLRFTGRAALAGLLIGIAGGIAQRFIPSGSMWSSAAIASIPFVVMGGAILYYAARGTAEESVTTGGPLDRAIAIDVAAYRPADDLPRPARPGRSRPGARLRAIGFRDRGSVVVIAVLALIPLLLTGSWAGVYYQGAAFAVIFLSFAFVSGEGGMISLCQITFAGIGGIAAAQLAATLHWPVALAVLCAGLIALPVGLLVGFLGAVLGDIYFALVTLAFGLLIENVVFTINRFANYGSGVIIARPGFAAGDLALTYCILVVFVFFAVVLTNLRRSTPGLGAGVTRSSSRAARSLGMNPITTRMLLSGLGATVAGIGGALLAVAESTANPSSFGTVSGLVWLAVVVTLGMRSAVAALLAGVAFAVVPAVFTTYLPLSYAQVPVLLFGLGAVMVARNQRGIVALHAAQAEALASRLPRPRPRHAEVSAGTGSKSPPQEESKEFAG
jgi:branched-chain amino acid transport system permease protein